MSDNAIVFIPGLFLCMLLTEARLAVYRTLPDLDASNAQAARAAALQNEIWAGAIATAREAPPHAMLLLLPVLNEMIDITTRRAVALRTHTRPRSF